MTTTITGGECVVMTPPPYPITFSAGPAIDGSCASYTAQYPPPDTITLQDVTSTTNGPPPTTTATTQAPTCYPSCVMTGTPGYAGVSGGGENCGAGPTGSCPTTTTVPVPATAVPLATPLAFTGADLELTGGVGLLAVTIGAVMVIRAHRRLS